MRDSKDFGVSILILSYNHSGFIERCIQSVFEQYNDLHNLELIVLDDGSSDGTPELLRNLEKTSPIPMRLILQDHKGVPSISKNLNTLISYAEKKYIAFLASDDFYLPNRFQRQISIMEKDRTVQLVYGNGTNLLNGDFLGDVHPIAVMELLKTRDSKKMYDYVTSGTPQLFLQTAMVRREFLFDFKPFDENLIADDWVFNILCFKRLLDLNLSFSSIDDKLFVRNILQSSTSNNVPVHYKRVAQTAEIYIENTKRAFYFRFYWKYFKLFLRRGRIRSAAILLVRLFFIGFPFHNKRLSTLI